MAYFDAKFGIRALSAIVLAPLVLAVVYYGKMPFILLMAISAAISIYEWAGMTLSDIKESVDKKIQPIAMAFSFFTVIITGVIGNPAITLWIILAFCFFLFSYNISHKGPAINRFLFGIIYIVFSIEIMVWVRNFSNFGLFHTITLLAMVWASDIFAYLSGKAIGGPKLAPVISPNKTWAGFIGAMIGSGVTALIIALVGKSMEVELLFHPALYFVVGMIMAVFGQCGDLLISIVKRFYKIKDTGNIIPGHGGILDRIDALLLVAIIFGTIVFYLA